MTAPKFYKSQYTVVFWMRIFAAHIEFSAVAAFVS